MLRERDQLNRVVASGKSAGLFPDPRITPNGITRLGLFRG